MQLQCELASQECIRSSCSIQHWVLSGHCASAAHIQNACSACVYYTMPQIMDLQKRQGVL